MRLFPSLAVFALFTGAAQAEGITCAATLEPSGQRAVVSGVVRGAEAVEGNYRLVVVTKSGGNSSVSMQGGAFDKPQTASELFLDTSIIFLNPGASVEAELTLQTAEGNIACKNILYHYENSGEVIREL